MFENIAKFFKKFGKNKEADSKETAKERLHLVLMQDRANVSADFLELMKQEIIDVIKKYIDVDETSIDVRLTNKTNGDGTTGAPALYANIPIVSIKDENKNKVMNDNKKEDKKEEHNKEEQNSKEENEKVEDKSEQKAEETKEEVPQKEEKVEESENRESNEIQEEAEKENNEIEDDNKENSEEDNQESEGEKEQQKVSK